MKRLSAFTAAMLFVTATSHASSLAFDNAADPAYTGGVINGQNGGSGFGAWLEQSQNGPNGSGSFIGSSQNNGFSDGNIDVSGKSWGLYANTNGDVNGNTEVLYRNFTGGSLGVGQTLTLSMDNGFIDSNKVVGLVLRTGTDTSNKNDGSRFEFLFIGDNNPGNYFAFGSSFDDTGVGYTSAGLDLAFTLTGTDAYSLSISNHSTGGVAVHTGTLGGTLGAGIDSIALYNQTAGNGGSQDLFFNSLAIIPEPQSVLLVVMGLAGLWAVIRRRTSATVVAVLGLALVIPGAFATIITVASDNAADSAYSSGWNAGPGGGFGFGDWQQTVNAGNGYFYVNSRTSNPQTISPGIDTSSKSWGISADNSPDPSSVFASRSFTAGSLQIGQTFQISLQNGYVDGGAVGIDLRHGNNTSAYNDGERLSLYFAPGGSWNIYNGHANPTLLGYDTGGFTVDFTLTGANTYSVTMSNLSSGASTTVAGTFTGSGGIDSVALYSQQTSSDANHNMYFNSMSITEAVPEPAMVVLMLLGGTIVYVRRLRHARS